MSVLLEVDCDTYIWRLPDGREELTVVGLKDSIKERSQHKVLYHDRLRFSAGGEPIADEGRLPLEPAVVRVSGPGSVVRMFALWCRANVDLKLPPRAKGPQQQEQQPREAAQKPRKPAGLMPQAVPLQSRGPGAKAPQRAPAVLAPEALRKPRGPAAQPGSDSRRLLEALRRQEAAAPGPGRERLGNLEPQKPRSGMMLGRAPGLPASQAAGIVRPPGLGRAAYAADAGWRAGADELSDASAAPDWGASALQQAVGLGSAAYEAATEEAQREAQREVQAAAWLAQLQQEEAQLEWAIEESLRLARQQEEQVLEPPVAEPGASPPALHGAPGSGEAEEEQEEDEEEGEEPGESSDEEPPPLELIPNSEE